MANAEKLKLATLLHEITSVDEAVVRRAFEDRHRGASHAYAILPLPGGRSIPVDLHPITSRLVARCRYCEREGDRSEPCTGCGASHWRERIEGTLSATMGLPKPSLGTPRSS